MPIYEYEHLTKPCKMGKVFDLQQSLSDDPVKTCPHCGEPVQKIVSKINISCPRSDRELRDLGFTKLVKRDDGVYENVTARNGDSRYMKRGRPETIPDVRKTIGD